LFFVLDGLFRLALGLIDGADQLFARFGKGGALFIAELADIAVVVLEGLQLGLSLGQGRASQLCLFAGFADFFQLLRHRVLGVGQRLFGLFGLALGLVHLLAAVL